MGKSQGNRVYDLAVIGNGIAAQAFLWNLTEEECKSQNFSIAHLYSKEIAPPCSLRSSATVSLNGIEEDVSPLGNDMRDSFFLFEKLFNDHHPDGVEEVKRTVVSTNENDTKKLMRRYKTLQTINNSKLKESHEGSEYNSYIITPDVFLQWMTKNISVEKTDFPFFVKNLEKAQGLFQVILQSGEIVKAKKVLFATGAYSKILENFYTSPESDSNEIKNMIKAGSYLERTIDLGPESFYFSIDGHQVLYRKNKNESILIIGSVTTVGAYEAPDVKGLVTLFDKLKILLSFEIGNFTDFKIVTGLRHKGPKRLLIAKNLEDPNLFQINGLYKNGYTMSFLAAKRMKKLLLL